MILHYSLLLLGLHSPKPDSIRELQEVVISATKSERDIRDIPLPVTVIGTKQLQRNGMVRLDQALQEQSGLGISADHGKGLQMQGLDADYTLILIDGEPVIGRTAGTFDLNRIALGNVERIEIVKGPSSALYGSEALAGVVNIISKQPKEGLGGYFSARYGTNSTSDFSAQSSLRKKNSSFSLFANRYASEGYKLQSQSESYTVGPFAAYTLQAKASRYFDKGKVNLSLRYYKELQTNRYSLDSGLIDQKGQLRDFSINPTLEYVFTSKLSTHARFYYSRYATKAEDRYTEGGTIFDDSYFKQGFLRTESQWEYVASEKAIITAGAGFLNESVEATRYTALQQMQSGYAYGQVEYTPFSSLQIFASGRFDANSRYKDQFSPKLSMQYKPFERLKVQFSGGRGYKAPDFRQLYLNFTNNMAGYSVFGTQELSTQLEKLQRNGEIDTVLVDPVLVKTLDAESSWAYNLSLDLKYANAGNIVLSVFWNDLHNMIDTRAVATKTNGQSVFSYFNLNNVVTRGLEAKLDQQIRSLKVQVAYQYLDAYDTDVHKQIEAGTLFARDPETLESYRISEKQYGGLFNRSKHSGTLALTYDNIVQHWDATARFIYRSRFGFGDRNGNLVLDQENEYAKGYATLNVSASKFFFSQKLRVQLAIENLMNYRDTMYLPYVVGRLYNVTLSYSFQKSK